MSWLARTIGIGLMLLAPLAHAYTCPEPRDRSFKSENGRYRLDVGAGKHVRLIELRPDGERIAWERDFDYLPDHAYVADDGRRVVMIETAYHEGPPPRDLFVIGAQGEPLKAYALAEFASNRELEDAGWKCGTWWWVSADRSFRRNGDRSTFVIERFAKTIVIDLDTLALSVTRDPSRAPPRPPVRLDVEQVGNRVRLTLTNRSKRSVRLVVASRLGSPFGIEFEDNDFVGLNESRRNIVQTLEPGGAYSFVSETFIHNRYGRMRAFYEGEILDGNYESLTDRICRRCWKGTAASWFVTLRARRPAY